MNRVAAALVLFGSLGCRASGFENIKPSTKLTWTPCFDDSIYQCSRLEVPLDYANTTLGTTSIAFIKMAGKNATVASPSIVLIPGGPGGSGVYTLLAYQSLIGQMFGEQYNFVSFDPRGVNNSGPSLDCFSGNAEARRAFNRLHVTGVTNISSTSLQEQYYSASIYGEWCNDAVQKESPYGYYVTTPAVARDLLTFIDAEAEGAGQAPSDAKLWCYAGSYGTVIGSTFAAMFPDRVGRMVLDGLMDTEQYYDNDWRDNVEQMDEAMAQFSSLCHSAGPERCSVWGPTPANITARMDGLIHRLQNHPVPVTGLQSQGSPTLVTYSDLKTLFMQTIYTPLSRFPVMAEILHQLERGNASALAGMVDRLGITSDAGPVIRCADSYRRNKLTTIDEFRGFVEYSISKSKYLGDMWPMFVETILCLSVRPQLPDSMMAQERQGLDRPTAFPILFTSNTIDPISPLSAARKMSSRFPGSVLLLQDAIG
ncbi:alpha/beta-hydrolase, partial [Apiospora rasikravindrae]